MGKRIKECDLRREAGYGAGSGNTWDDVLSLGRRTNGTYRLRLRRHPNDYYASDDSIDSPVTLYCSPAFRNPERLLEMLLDRPSSNMQRYGAWPGFELPDVLLTLRERGRVRRIVRYDGSSRFGVATPKR